MRHRISWMLLIFLLYTFSFSVADAQTANSSAAPSSTSAPVQTTTEGQWNRPKVTAYTLPPELYKKAHARSSISFRLQIIGFFYGLAVLLVILRWKLSAKYRDWAEASSKRRFLRAVIYAPLLLITIAVLTPPLDIYSETVDKRFGISVQNWGSWAWDWVKAELIAIVLFTILIWLLYAVIRWSPRFWWFYFWLASLPILIFVFFVSPWVIAPLFNKFEPLRTKDPGLTASLERMVQRAGEDIPPERMFWMGAGEKTTALNAYVTGMGASKRIVVWDTTIAKMDTPQIVFVAGHEMGHYVLHHVPQLLTFFAVLILVLLYLGYLTIGSVLARWGAGWGIRAIDDWASLPALLILLSIFMFAANPIANGFSRHEEHQADQYGLEVTHGLNADSGQVAAQSFQVLGEVDLADPDPNPVNVFLFYSHPTISDRVQFALSYDPWSHGGTGEFVK